MTMTCPREPELLEALERSFVGADLSAHIATCASCHELHTVAAALLEDRAEAMRTAPIPTAGTMWWRMQLRQRHEAAAAARRSLLIGQAVTLTVAIALVISFFGSELASDVRYVASLIHLDLPLVLVVATLALVTPIAGWAAVRERH